MTGENNASRPDFTSGFALRDLPDDGKGPRARRHRGRDPGAQGDGCSPSARTARTITVRWLTVSIVGDTVRCPWHHACFSLRTGDALRAPALDPIACWRVERVGDTVYVREKQIGAAPTTAPPSRHRRAAHVGRHRRRRRAPAWPRRTCFGGKDTTVADDDQRGRFAAERSTESVEGLSGGHRAGRLDSAAICRVLHRAANRPGAECARVVARRRGRSRSSSTTARRMGSTRC